MSTKTLLGFSAAAACLAASPSSWAQQAAGWYAAVDAGQHTADPIHTTVTASPSLKAMTPESLEWMAEGVEWVSDRNFSASNAFGKHGLINARVGYGTSSNFRFELEAGYRSGVLQAINVPSAPVTSVTGNIESETLMANVIYDFAPRWRVAPFVGLGVGGDRTHVNANGWMAYPLVPAGSNSMSVNSAEIEGAWQALAGLTWSLSDRTSIDLTGHYMAGRSSSWMASFGPNPVNGTLPSARFSGAYRDVSVSIGLRYVFAAKMSDQ